jgi:ubiquinone/menaquinone biosynthesis C-methylase UbiE
MSHAEQAFCRSAPWRAFTRTVVLPWALQGVRLQGRVLEIGAGSGAMAAAMAEARPDLRLTVTDYDPSMVEAAARSLSGHEGVEVRQADAARLPFEDGSFDGVVSFIMLHHVGAWEEALAQASRVLRPGGALVGYDLLANRLMHAACRAGAEHRVMRHAGHRVMGHAELRTVPVPELRSTLAALPLTDVTVRPGLGRFVVRFRARRA